MVGSKFVPNTIQTSVNFRNFEELYLSQFSTIHYQTKQFYQFKGALSSSFDRFSLTCPCQKLKKRWEGLFIWSSQGSKILMQMNGRKNQCCKQIDCFAVDSSHLNLTFQTNKSYGQINIISMAFLSSRYKRLSPETSPVVRSGKRQLYLQAGSRQVKLEWIIMFRLGLLEYSSSILYQHSIDIVRSKCPLMARVR